MTDGGRSQRLHLAKQGRDEKGTRGAWGWTPLCNLSDDIPPEVQAGLFNHTTDYAIIVRRPAAQQASKQSLDPRSSPCLTLNVPPFVHPLLSGVLRSEASAPPYACVCAEDNERDLFESQELNKRLSVLSCRKWRANEVKREGNWVSIYCSRMMKKEHIPIVISQKRMCGRQLASVMCQLYHNVTKLWKYLPK